MATTTINVPEDTLLNIDLIVHKFGFKNKEEFVEEAIRDKVLDVKRKMFFTGSSKIAANLQKKGISEEEILADFERTRN